TSKSIRGNSKSQNRNATEMSPTDYNRSLHGGNGADHSKNTPTDRNHLVNKTLKTETQQRDPPQVATGGPFEECAY
ncbi:11321_t:CDS:2, partial [Acaulospora morrowiae]